MTEKLLQFIWHFQYFNKNDLLTVTGDRIRITDPGKINYNQGPDFLDAKIDIAGTIWAGTVELHVQASDWNKHNMARTKTLTTSFYTSFGRTIRRVPSSYPTFRCWNYSHGYQRWYCSVTKT